MKNLFGKSIFILLLLQYNCSTISQENTSFEDIFLEPLVVMGLLILLAIFIR